MANLTEEVRHSSGGKLVTVETAPYTVAIRCENTGALCTGTLITLDLVLTLARCFYKGMYEVTIYHLVSFENIVL